MHETCARTRLPLPQSPLCLRQYDHPALPFRVRLGHYRKHKGAVKLHTQLNLSGTLPCYVVLSNGRIADIRAARKWFKIEPDSIYTYDKGYCDYAWFKEIDGKAAFFFTRLKQNTRLKVVGQHLAANEKLGVVADDIVELGFKTPGRRIQGNCGA